MHKKIGLTVEGGVLAVSQPMSKRIVGDFFLLPGGQSFKFNFGPLSADNDGPG
jgi:hypothetical protein